jgi:hypothetical protein
LIDEALLAITILDHPDLSSANIRCIIAIRVEVVEFDMATWLEMGFDRTAVLRSPVFRIEEINHGSNGWHGANEDTDCGFNNGPVHRDSHGPGGVGIDEKTWKEGETNAGGDNGTAEYWSAHEDFCEKKSGTHTKGRPEAWSR